MPWTVLLCDEFSDEIDDLPIKVQDEIFKFAGLLQEFGSNYRGNRKADTLKGSKISNLKELRFKASDGVWRVLYAFDPKRQAIILIAGDKSGVSQKRFYKQIIKKAEERYDNHLSTLDK